MNGPHVNAGRPDSDTGEWRPRERPRLPGDVRRDFRPRKKGITGRTWLSFALLLVLPGCVVARVCPPMDLRVVLGLGLALFAVTYFIYWDDKKRAQNGAWRTPESTLHLAEFLGGWPAAFLAQRVLRHKISKRNYQVKFWLIVALHQFVALDFLLKWQMTRTAFYWVRQQLA